MSLFRTIWAASALGAALCLAHTGAGHAQTFTYDARGRVTSATYADGAVIAWTYDAAGNRTQQTISTGGGAERTPTSFTASSNYGSMFSGLTATNGMRDGVFDTVASMHGTNNDATATITADLGSSLSIGHISVACAPASAPGGWGCTYLNGATVEASNDGSSWTSVGAVSGATEGTTTNVTFAATTRYVRLRKSSNYLAVGDFRIYGP